MPPCSAACSAALAAALAAARSIARAAVVAATAAVAAVACRAPGVDRPQAPPSPAPAVFDPAAIDAWVGAEIARRGAVGAALVVVRGGETVLARGYGVRRVGEARAVDADTPFAIGSVSKQFACAAALTLADEGKLSMSDRVAKYYPALSGAADIELADLGGHVAGYRDYYPLDYVDRRMLAPIEPDALIAQYAGLPLDFPPRTRSSYSNTGFVLLARIVERASGAAYGALLAERFWRPLGMTRTTLSRPADAATGHEAFLLEAPVPAVVEADGWLFGAADIWASARDLARWDVALAEGTVLSEAARRAMATPRVTVGGRGTGYGCGLVARQIAGEAVLAHGGWVGGFVAHNAVVPRARTAVVLLVNDQHVDLGDVHDRVLRLAIDDPSAIPAIPTPAAEAARALVLQLQRGRVDRAALGEDLSEYLDERRVAAASPKLRALGEPRVTLVSRAERGGMEVTHLSIAFPKRTVSATMFRDASGKIRQLIMQP
jgi:D-alanyl-D-alanine carboxypeptidase